MTLATADYLAGTTPSPQRAIADAPRGKIRKLWVVLVLLLLTLGLYYLFWWYTANRELRDFGARRDKYLDIRPGGALLAVMVGWLLIIPPFVSGYRTFKRIRRAEQLARIEDAHQINHVLGFVLFLVGMVLFPIEVFYGQLHLNRLWQRLEDEERKTRAGMRAAPGY